MKLTAAIQKRFAWIVENEIRTAFFVFAIIAPVVVVLDRSYSIGFKDVLGDINGSIFDLILFGVVFVVFSKTRERSKQIKELIERIEDFRDWKSSRISSRLASTSP